MTYQTEFPDFPSDAMPAIPEGFSDRSWGNEGCPCFIHEATGVVLWINYPEAAEDGEARYSVDRCGTRDPEAGWQFDEEMEHLFAWDDWETVLRSLPNFMAADDPRRLAS